MGTQMGVLGVVCTLRTLYLAWPLLSAKEGLLFGSCGKGVIRTLYTKKSKPIELGTNSYFTTMQCQGKHSVYHIIALMNLFKIKCIL